MCGVCVCGTCEWVGTTGVWYVHTWGEWGRELGMSCQLPVH